MIFPEWTTFNIAHHILFAVLALVTGPFVYFAQPLENYNKPRSGPGLHPRAAMALLYSAPILALFFSAKDYLPSASPLQWTVVGAVFIHFLKRVLESLFLHKYSRRASLVNALVVGSFYSQTAFTIGWLNRSPIPAADLQFTSGVTLFLIGIAGNFYHHKRLADLRRESRGYFIPQGGLFQYVVCPHYLFEIVGWLGITLLSRHTAAWMNLLVMISFLTGQGLRALDWYRVAFADFPKDRKAILPFIL